MTRNNWVDDLYKKSKIVGLFMFVAISIFLALNFFNSHQRYESSQEYTFSRNFISSDSAIINKVGEITKISLPISETVLKDSSRFLLKVEGKDTSVLISVLIVEENGELRVGDYKIMPKRKFFNWR